MPHIALQMYTVRDFAGKDLTSTLAEIKAMGYDAIELAGTYGLEADVFRQLLDNAGLRAISTHTGYHELAENPTNAVAKYKALGCEIIGIPGIPLAELPGGENYEVTLAGFHAIAAACANQGVTLVYHNHDYEFKKLDDGRFVLDALFDAVPQLQTELDTGWITAAGEDPVAYIKRYTGRCPVVHLKDTATTADGTQDRPVGHGQQDMPAIIRTAIESGTTCLVAELDHAVGITSLEAARQSRAYLKSLGY